MYLHAIAEGYFKNPFSQKIGDTFTAIILIFFNQSGNNSFSGVIKKQDYQCQRIFYLKDCQRLTREMPLIVTKIFRFGCLLLDF